jgi:hypothetical protein
MRFYRLKLIELDDKLLCSELRFEDSVDEGSILNLLFFIIRSGYVEFELCSAI